MLLSEQLMDAGHEVFFTCSEGKSDLIESIDIDHNRDRFHLETIVSLGDEGLSSNVGDPFNWHTKESAQEFVEEEIQHVRENDTDVIIGDMRPTPKVTALITNRPFVPLVYAFYKEFTKKSEDMLEIILPSTSLPVSPKKMFDSALKKNVDSYNLVLRDMGEPPQLNGFYDLYTGDLNVMPDMGEMYELTQDKPSNAHFVGPFFEDLKADANLPDWLRELKEADSPIVFCCYGSVAHRNMVDATIDAFASTDYEVVITLGDLKAKNLETDADNVHVFDYIDPFDEVIHYSSLIIFPGGAETAYKSLRGGVPMILAPELLEQEYMAHRLEELGIGRRFDGGKLTPEDLREATEDLLHDSGVQENLNSYREQLESYRGLDRSVELLNNFTAHGSLDF